LDEQHKKTKESRNTLSLSRCVFLCGFPTETNPKERFTCLFYTSVNQGCYNNSIHRDLNPNFFFVSPKIQRGKLTSLFLRPLSVNKKSWTIDINALFSSPQNSKFFHSLSIISIFSCLHRVLNVDKKDN
jgi:hypothetical protein